MSTIPRAVATRQMPHPAGTVFAAWLDPAQIGHWLFAGDELTRLRRRSGRRRQLRLRRPPRGGLVLHHTGVYQRIDPPHHLSFSWAVTGGSRASSAVGPDTDSGTGSSILDVDMEPAAGGCAVTITLTQASTPA